MAEFRKSTIDFKDTCEKEVDFEEFKETNQIKPVSSTENSIAKSELKSELIKGPEIKEIRQEDFDKVFSQPKSEQEFPQQTVKAATGKQDWL